MAVLTPQHEDFPRWYQDVLTKAKLAENGPALPDTDQDAGVLAYVARAY